jgi:hypothetical protein
MTETIEGIAMSERKEDSILLLRGKNEREVKYFKEVIMHGNIIISQGYITEEKYISTLESMSAEWIAYVDKKS